MDLRDCLETIRFLLEDRRDVEQERAVSVFRRLIESGAPEELAAQGMLDSGHFERRDILHAIEVVLGRSSEEAPQLFTRGRFTNPGPS